jgi:hypothetical protein
MVGTSTWCDSRRLCRDPDFLAGAPADSPIYTEVNNSSSRRFLQDLVVNGAFCEASKYIWRAKDGGLALESGPFSCKNLYSKHSSNYVTIQNKNMYVSKNQKKFLLPARRTKFLSSRLSVAVCEFRIVKKEISKVVKN